MNALTHLRRTGVRLTLLANLVFWIVFWMLFFAQSEPYKPHRPRFEEVFPYYIFFGRGLHMIDPGTGAGLPPALIEVAHAVQKLSFLAARPYYWYFDRRGIVVNELYGGISVGGYFLLLVMLLSFLQWYAVGLVIDWLLAKRRRAQG